MTAPRRSEIEAQIEAIEKQLSAIQSGLVEAWLWSPIGCLASTPSSARNLSRGRLSASRTVATGANT